MATTNPVWRSMKYGMLSASFLCMLLLSQALSAQRYTYVGGGMSLFSAHMSMVPDPFIEEAPFAISGGAYDVTIRHVINHFLSLETGISAHNIQHEYLFKKKLYLSSGGLAVHKIPLKAELDVDVFRDRIAAYASFGYQFCISSGGDFGILGSYPADGSVGKVDTEWRYISDGRIYSLFQVGAGSRIRVVDELLFEVELGYAFSVKDRVEYAFTYLDEAGEEYTFTHREGLNYWYLQCGFSYPVQRVVEIINDVLKSSR